MAKTLYCWRCKAEVPMLDDQEWLKLSPLMSAATEEIKQYREIHCASLAEARGRQFGEKALALYEELTGFKESNVDALWHHRLSDVGDPCATCGKPLRSRDARFCAECGAVAAALS